MFGRRWLYLAILSLVAVASFGCTSGNLRDSGTSTSTTTGRASTGSHLHTGVTELSIPYRAYGQVKAIEDDLYISVDSGSGYLDRIVRVDAETSECVPVLRSEDNIGWFDMSDEWIVWESDPDLVLHARRISGTDIQTLADGQEVFGPKIEGDSVVWMDRVDQDRYQVVVHGLNENATRTIADISLPGFYNNFIDIRGGQVLWTDIIDDVGYYRMAPIGGAVTDYALSGTEFRFPGYAQAWQDKIYSINFRTYGEWTWSDQQFGFFSTATGKFSPIGTGSINRFQVCANRVGVLDENQQLVLYDAADPKRSENVSDELDRRFDDMDCADERTLVVGSAAEPGSSTCSLVLLTLP